MSTIWFPLAVGVLELAAGLHYAWKGQWWDALVWSAYALACVGLAFSSKH